MKEHEAHLPSKLTVISGQVILQRTPKRVTLNNCDEVDITSNTKHTKEAMVDSLYLLTQG